MPTPLYFLYAHERRLRSLPEPAIMPVEQHTPTTSVPGCSANDQSPDLFL